MRLGMAGINFAVNQVALQGLLQMRLLLVFTACLIECQLLFVQFPLGSRGLGLQALFQQLLLTFQLVICVLQVIMFSLQLFVFGQVIIAADVVAQFKFFDALGQVVLFLLERRVALGPVALPDSGQLLACGIEIITQGSCFELPFMAGFCGGGIAIDKPGTFCFRLIETLLKLRYRVSLLGIMSLPEN